MKFSNFLAFFVLCVISLSSCKDDPTTKELLESGTWKFSTMTMSPGVVDPTTGELITNLLAGLPTCATDGTFQFLSSGVYVEDEGPTMCYQTDPQTIEGTWSINESTDVVTTTIDGITTIANIVAISEDELTWTSTMKVNNVIQTATAKLVH